MKSIVHFLRDMLLKQVFLQNCCVRDKKQTKKIETATAIGQINEAGLGLLGTYVLSTHISNSDLLKGHQRRISLLEYINTCHMYFVVFIVFVVHTFYYISI